MSNGLTKIEKKTKEIYIEQHKNYGKDQELFARFYNVAVDPASYGLTKDFFRGKTVLDAGCGNSAYFQKAMYDLGAAHVTCMDLGDEWIPVLDKELARLGIPSGFYRLIPGSTSKIPLESEQFDFVASNGVLMHLSSKEEANVALSELARVTKVGGCLYAHCGISNAGIFDKYITPALRSAYANEPEFRELIDTISPEIIAGYAKELIDTMCKFDGSVARDRLISALDLFTLDTSTFIQNALQVPVDQGAELGFQWAQEQLLRLGFERVERIPERYWKRTDVRKFLSPIHYLKSNKLSRIFYGDGRAKVIAKKKQASAVKPDWLPDAQALPG